MESKGSEDSDLSGPKRFLWIIDTVIEELDHQKEFARIKVIYTAAKLSS